VQSSQQSPCPLLTTVNMTSHHVLPSSSFLFAALPSIHR
jgi:hypothetical protein